MTPSSVTTTTFRFTVTPRDYSYRDQDSSPHWRLLVKEAKRGALSYGIDIRRALWLGVRNETTINAASLRARRVVLVDAEQLQRRDQVKDAAIGLFDWSDNGGGLEEYLYQIFKFGSDEK